MPKLKPEPRKPGRPVLPKSEAKGKIVPVRFKDEDLAKIAKAAKKSNQTVSEWIRTKLSEAVQ
jgi:predicted HicB family RNase H-like nuclease